MKGLPHLLVLLLYCLLVWPNVSCSEVRLEANENLIKHDHWLPPNGQITFRYNDSGRLDGFEVSFKVRSTRLFREWVLYDGDKHIGSVPFVLEVTLIIKDNGEVEDLAYEKEEHARDTRGEYWDYGLEGMCTEYALPAYMDSIFCDPLDDKIGIGILHPQLFLQEGEEYTFWVKMRQLDSDISSLRASLRFRLNMDVGLAREYGYDPGGNFELGDEWQFAYETLLYSGDHQDIAEYFSFAITNFKAKDEELSDGKYVNGTVLYEIPLEGTHTWGDK